MNLRSTLNAPPIDEWITKQDYDKKLQEFTDRLQRLNIELEEHTQADHDYKTSVGTVLSVAQRAKSIFISSEAHEKRQFINLLVQDARLKDRELTFELKTPFDLVLNLADYASQERKTTSLSTDRSAWLRIVDDVRTAIQENGEYVRLPNLTAADLFIYSSS